MYDETIIKLVLCSQNVRVSACIMHMLCKCQEVERVTYIYAEPLWWEVTIKVQTVYLIRVFGNAIFFCNIFKF